MCESLWYCTTIEYDSCGEVDQIIRFEVVTAFFTELIFFDRQMKLSSLVGTYSMTQFASRLKRQHWVDRLSPWEARFNYSLYLAFCIQIHSKRLCDCQFIIALERQREVYMFEVFTDLCIVNVHRYFFSGCPLLQTDAFKTGRLAIEWRVPWHLLIRFVRICDVISGNCSTILLLLKIIKIRALSQ